MDSANLSSHNGKHRSETDQEVSTARSWIKGWEIIKWLMTFCQ